MCVFSSVCFLCVFSVCPSHRSVLTTASLKRHTSTNAGAKETIPGMMTAHNCAAPTQRIPHTCIHTYIYAYIHTQTYIHICIHTYIHKHTCIHAYIHIYIHIHFETHMSVCYFWHRSPHCRTVVPLLSFFSVLLSLLLLFFLPFLSFLLFFFLSLIRCCSERLGESWCSPPPPPAVPSPPLMTP